MENHHAMNGKTHENSLFRLGHFLCRKVWMFTMFTRGYPLNQREMAHRNRWFTYQKRVDFLWQTVKFSVGICGTTAPRNTSRCPLPFVGSVGRSREDPLKTSSAPHWGVFGDAYKPTRDWVSSARYKIYLESWGMYTYIYGFVWK